MKRGIVLAAVLALVLPLGGCQQLIDILTPSNTTVRLVNNGSFPIDVVLYYGGDQNALEDILTTLGEKVEVTVAAGATHSFSVDCDDLQAIVIDNAELRLLGGIGPEQSTEVFRDGTDFNCGDTLIFTFTHPLLPIQLDIAFSTSAG